MVEEDTKKEVLDADAYYEKGNYYYEQGDYDRAIENYNMAIILNPRFLECYFNRALCYYNKKNYDKAIEDYTKAIEIDPDNPMIYNNRGDAYYRKQDFEKAIADYNKAISLNPEYLKAYYNRGLAYASMQDYESGVENFTKVIELDPNFVEAYNARGLAYEFLEKYDEAIADYQKALEINPNFTEAQEHLAAAQKKKSEKEASSGEGVSAVKFMAKPKVTFKDVVGMDQVKELIREYIVYPLKDPELARKYGKFGGGGVLFYGPPGCGKCVSPDTPIQLSNGQILSIEEVYNIAKGNGKEIKVGEEEIVENPSVKVLSLNPTTLKIEEKNVLFAYKQRYKGKMYEIITRSGRKISVTPEHPFFSVDNGVVKIKAKDLSVGSYIATPRELTVQPVPLIANESQDMFLPISIFRIQNSGLDSVSNQTNVRLGYKTYRRPAKEFNQINYVDQDVAELFGYLLSEGSSNGGTIFFFNSDKNLVDRVEHLSSKVFGIKPRIKPDRSQNVLRLEISSTGLIKYLEQTHGFKLIGSRNTKVPISIITAKNKIVAEFLSAVFESEANIRKDVPEIEFITASKVFANQISYLLLRFGIIGRIKEKSVRGYDHTYYRIYVTGHNQLKLFEETIGFKSERKRELLRKWTSNQVKENTNVDVIPNISNLLMKAREGLGMNKEQFYNTSSKHGKAYESSKHLSRNLVARLISDKRETNEIKELRLLSDSSVLWDEVVKIREFDYDGFVYDLTVEDNHNFIAGFGGIVVHNTFIMKAAAGEVGANFLNVKLSDVLDMYVGNTEKNIRNIFEAARKASPCIIFIDEIDGLGGRREQMKESGQYMRMAVNQLLYEMDGVEARNENVLVVAATNAPWDVDPALRRAGRFSKLIYVGEPDYASRKAMFQYYAKGRPVSKNVDWDRLARATEGYSSSDIKAISDDAAAIPWIEALKTGKQREITMKDYIEVLDPFAADPIKYLTAAKKPKGKKSSLPPWYESAKKEIGKQEEVETVDGKEIKRIKEPKMPPGEREYFKELIDLIESRNKPHNKFLLWLWRKSALYQDYLVPFVIAGIIYLLYIAFQSSLGF
ncbi:MAG: tetratricopeptide repeat protein [Candidatus Micrarchaeia archaeon]